MVVQARLETRGDALQDDIDSLRALDEIVQEAGQKVLTRIAPYALEEMRHYPPPAKLPFDFGSKAARDEYFDKVRRGLVPTVNGRYARTGQLAASMFFAGRGAKGQYAFRAGSRSKIARKVVGGFGSSPDIRTPGHINTGWPKLSTTVNYWLTAADEDMKKEVHSVYIAYRSTRKNK